jgi:hypothetical protein
LAIPPKSNGWLGEDTSGQYTQEPIVVRRFVNTRPLVVAGFFLICTSVCTANGSPDPGSAKKDEAKKTLGFVLTVWKPAFYETPGAGQTECPSGLANTNKENWLAQYPTPEA